MRNDAKLAWLSFVTMVGLFLVIAIGTNSAVIGFCVDGMFFVASVLGLMFAFHWLMMAPPAKTPNWDAFMEWLDR